MCVSTVDVMGTRDAKYQAATPRTVIMTTATGHLIASSSLAVLRKRRAVRSDSQLDAYPGKCSGDRAVPLATKEAPFTNS